MDDTSIPQPRPSDSARRSKAWREKNPSEQKPLTRHPSSRIVCVFSSARKNTMRVVLRRNAPSKKPGVPRILSKPMCAREIGAGRIPKASVPMTPSIARVIARNYRQRIGQLRLSVVLCRGIERQNWRGFNDGARNIQTRNVHPLNVADHARSMPRLMISPQSSGVPYAKPWAIDARTVARSLPTRTLLRTTLRPCRKVGITRLATFSLPVVPVIAASVTRTCSVPSSHFSYLKYSQQAQMPTANGTAAAEDA